MSRELVVILGMAAVTLAARVVPVLLAGFGRPPKRVQDWLEAVPFAALGALIVPGIVTADAARPWVGITAALAAVVAALLRAPIYLSAVAAVAAAYLVQQWG